jgi:regulator of replication initiation timing
VAKGATMAREAELDVIDRLEDKVRLLVGAVERLKTEQARAADENQRLTREIDALRARLADAESTSQELAVLREERNVIRSRVSEMLQQIEGLNL